MNGEPLFPSHITLNNGVKMPTVGLGTYRIQQGDTIMKTIDYALAAGYRMIGNSLLDANPMETWPLLFWIFPDTAAVYGNECHIKTALKTLLPKYGLEREDIFITTKLSPSDHGDRNLTHAAYRRSLENLGLDYVDLYLIHFPGSARIDAKNPRNKLLREMTWESLAELYDEGLVKTIGVSNFTIKHLQQVITSNHDVVPVVNQVEWHPYYHENDLLQYCRRNKIVLQAYGSLGGSGSNQALIEDCVVKKIALKHQATCSQVLLVWALQQDIAVIPKSTNPVHIKDNITFNFKLTDEEMKALDALGEKKVKYAWDPHPVF